MEWTSNQPPTEGYSHYDHTTLDTPLGLFRIEWKGWKDTPSYDIMLNGDRWIGCEYSLGDAKRAVKDYLITKRDELSNFISDTQEVQAIPNYEYEMLFESNETDFIKIDGWFPISTSSINHPEKIDYYIEIGLLRKIIN